jgi:hypothetical protein
VARDPSLVVTRAEEDLRFVQGDPVPHAIGQAEHALVDGPLPPAAAAPSI